MPVLPVNQADAGYTGVGADSCGNNAFEMLRKGGT